MSESDPIGKLDHAAADLVHVGVALDRLCIFIRADGDGRVRCIAPEVDPGELAKLLYFAADTYAAHAVNKLPTQRIKRLR